MFFGYPIAATSENWLHDCLVEMVTTIHTRLDKAQPPLKWPDCIPTARRPVLKSRRGLRDHLETYRVEIAKLKPKTRAQILRCLGEQNRVEDLLNGSSDCERLTDLPKSIRGPVDELFSFAFGLLTDLGIRDRHYKTIDDAIEHKVCPFCACEYLDAPVEAGRVAIEGDRQIREALDHYLPRSRYPFAAANLFNLSPMGTKCNTCKSDQDVIRNDAGVRRRAFYPYAKRKVSITLTSSVPFAGTDGRMPDWRIKFQPHSTECTTWDAVFSFQSRLKRNVLDRCFDQWLRDFAGWFRMEYADSKVTNAKVVAALKMYEKNEAIKGLNGRDCFRTLVFQMLHHHCAKKHSRLLAAVKDVLILAIPPRSKKSKQS